MSDKDYMDLVNENINLSKILYKVEPPNREFVTALIDKKQQIIKKNGFFASFRLKRINKKIEKYIK